MDEYPTAAEPSDVPPRWQPIGAIDRRVAGVLAEKAKTTPAGYPMSLNAVRTACNQKSNRAPVMDLAAEDVEESLERLRKLGATGMIEGYGRVVKYRHYLYEWLGVDKVELAVMAELLLRGAQTEGELRGRAARMEPIGDLGALRPVLASLKTKGLVIPLTPEGRGHVVTHALYQPRELENLKAQYGHEASAASPRATAPPAAAGPPEPGMPPDRPMSQPSVALPAAPAVETGPLESSPVERNHIEALRRDVDELRSQLAMLRGELDELTQRQQHSDEEVHELRDALGA